jgi:hypothetical protein
MKEISRSQIFAFLFSFTVSFFYVESRALDLITSNLSVFELVVWSAEKILPFVVFTYYSYQMIFKVSILEKILKFTSIITIALTSIFLFASTIGTFTKFPFKLFLNGYRWNYAGAIEWSSAFLILFLLFYLKMKNTSFSLVVSILAISFGSFAYEIPHFLSSNYLHPLFNASNPLLIDNAFISIVMLCLILNNQHFHLRKEIAITIIQLLLFSFFYYAYPRINGFMWIPRLPMIIFLISIPLCMKKTINLKKEAQIKS